MSTKFDQSSYTKVARGALARAQSLASRLKHQHVESEHVVLSILEEPNAGTQLLQALGVDTKAIGRQLIDELELLPKTYGRSDKVFVGKRLLAALGEAQDLAAKRKQQTDLAHMLAAITGQASSYAARQLRQAGVTADKILGEAEKSPAATEKSSAGDGEIPEVLAKYASDLTALAERGELDRIIGRDDEIRRMVQILSRRGKNNPVLIGEPGVGKSAIVEALAHRVAADDVPVGLKGKRILNLDVGSLVAGTSLRGQFEERIKAIVQAIIDSNGKYILFIDELHQIVGAGGGDGPMNASNLLKPALARGQISIIGTTTIDEYRQYIEADAGLERRFQTIVVSEASVEQCVAILRGVKQRYEIHHAVQIADAALVAAARMTDRYITERALPDKALDAIDEAASRLRLEIDSKPTELDELERRVQNLEIERQALLDETHPDAVESREKLSAEIKRLGTQADELCKHWEAEKEALTAVTEKKEELQAAMAQMEEYQRKGELGRAAELKYGALPNIEAEIANAQRALEEIHPGKRMLKDVVTEDDVGAVIASWTGIPVDKMLESEREKLLQMPDRLRQRVVGQDHAIELIASAIWRSRAGLQDRNRPMGNFMFVGPTGVGKTELAKALAEFLFDTEDSLIRIDMSEYMEQSKVNTLIGSARGYVGSEQGGVLTEAVRMKPYSVVLFDEAEKAHPDVFNILLQVMDEGRLTDSQGRRIDFTNTLVILTSNVGSRRILDLAGTVTGDELSDEVKNILKDHFRPEFLNRLDAPVVFDALDLDAIKLIVTIQERKLKKLLGEQKLTMEMSAAAREFLAQEGFEPEYGARPLRRAVQTYIQDPLAVEILEGKFSSGDHIVIDINDAQDALVFTKG